MSQYSIRMHRRNAIQIIPEEDFVTSTWQQEGATPQRDLELRLLQLIRELQAAAAVNSPLHSSPSPSPSSSRVTSPASRVTSPSSTFMSLRNRRRRAIQVDTHEKFCTQGGDSLLTFVTQLLEAEQQHQQQQETVIPPIIVPARRRNAVSVNIRDEICTPGTGEMLLQFLRDLQNNRRELLVTPSPSPITSPSPVSSGSTTAGATPFSPTSPASLNPELLSGDMRMYPDGGRHPARPQSANSHSRSLSYSRGRTSPYPQVTRPTLHTRSHSLTSSPLPSPGIASPSRGEEFEGSNFSNDQQQDA